jgi:hypothetical protein
MTGGKAHNGEKDEFFIQLSAEKLRGTKQEAEYLSNAVESTKGPIILTNVMSRNPILPRIVIHFLGVALYSAFN